MAIFILMISLVLADNCDSENLKTFKEKGYKNECEFVIEECKGSVGGNFNFFELYYCTFNDIFSEKGKLWAFIPFTLVVGFVLLYCLATTADEYLSPSLEFMTMKFGFSESLAGVTFLALGNGAPDVFTSIAAIGTSS